MPTLYIALQRWKKTPSKCIIEMLIFPLWCRVLGVENCAENTDASHIISLLQMAVLDAVAQYCKALRYFY